ncbi:MAG: hypothetical protein ACXWB9_09990, partial [Flavisolibacter sp.]
MNLFIKYISTQFQMRQDISGMVRLHLMTYMDLKSFLRSPEKSLLSKIRQHRKNIRKLTLFDKEGLEE